ncbi:MAG: hypothetical protein HKP12_00040 [Gammaproteobacteria bacterium]|nr:hypothetical protein [Gammaproteobacteria bacterium]
MLCCLLTTAVHAESACPTDQIDEFAVVRYVHDGDTVHLEDGRKVRLIGINTPELAQDNRPEQVYAQQARAFLNKALAKHDDRIGLRYGMARHDRHQRTLAHLFSPNGDNIQALLLRHGLAQAIAHPPSLAFADCYAQQEQLARCAGAGIWSHPQHTPVDADKLTAESTGFRLVSGHIDRVSRSNTGFWLVMADLLIHINQHDLAYFDAIDLPSLAGQHVIVRGWLQPARKKQAQKHSRGRTARYFVRIRHPLAIEINGTGIEAKC